jgi:hypothetical protein
MTMTAPPQPVLTRTLDPGVQWLVSRITNVSITESQGCEVMIDGTEITADTPAELQRDLGGHIYRTFHAGMVARGDSEFIPALLEDPELESRLYEATPVKHRRSQLPMVERAPGDSGLVLSLNGIRVFFESPAILSESEHSAVAAVPSVESRLSLGFMFYTSSAGAGRTSRLLRLYRHLGDPDEAVDVWSSFIGWVEERGLPLRVKIVSRRSGFPRSDGMVVYLPSESLHAVGDIAAHLRSDRPNAPASLLCQQITNGVTMAWEPVDTATPRGGTSFGEHRSNTIAKAIVAEAADPNPQILRAVRRALITANTDPGAVYRNLDSPVL